MLRALGCLGALALLVGAGVGGFIGGVMLYGETRSIIPLPHHTPPTEGGASFRFAMAHDVIHERYPKHGPAFYRERERLARERLKAIPNDSDEAFALTDDICAGLDRLGKPDDAVPLLREKLTLQEKRGLKGRDLYTTYANLGTFLVHANMGKAMRGDTDAKASVEEGLGFVKKSVEVNPEAHFGREKWQAAIIEFFLECMKRPILLTRTDSLGNDWERVFGKEAFETPVTEAWAEHVSTVRAAQPARRHKLYLVSDRERVTRVGGEWYGNSAPFDEPMLGIIGMWRQGGGANPHFTLCIGEVMLRVGQRYIAWTAFERASRMADRFWPDPAKQQFLRDHCARRQRQIEETLPASEVPGLRPKFEAELAFGEKYQREYQEYEAAKIAAGADIRDEHLFDDFHKTHEPISTPPGPEEYLVTSRVDYVGPKIGGAAGAVFAIGLVAFGLAVFWPRRKAAS